jgi:hypothetical protein
MLNRNYIIEVENENRLRLVDSNDPSKDLIILERKDNWFLWSELVDPFHTAGSCVTDSNVHDEARVGLCVSGKAEE